MSRPTLVSLFAGAGGLDLGFMWAGFEPVWANEIDPWFAKTYASQVADHVVVADVRDVLHQIPTDADVLVGGPPCQAFSLVGRRRPDDERGTLVFAYLEAVALSNPRAFVMENVPGLVASRKDGVRLPIYLAEEFQRLGYEVAIRKLGASEFGVPQRRQRVFIVGVKGTNGTTWAPDLEFAATLGRTDTSAPVTARQALEDLPPAIPKGVPSPLYDTGPTNWYARLMRRGNGRTVQLHEIPTMSALDAEWVKHIPPGGNYMDIPDDISTRRIMRFKSTGGRTTTYGRLHPDRPAYTINTYFNRPNVGANYHYSEERLITVREALRLQSFPDWFVPSFESQRSLHQQVGNAVPPLLAAAVASGLCHAMGVDVGNSAITEKG